MNTQAATTLERPIALYSYKDDEATWHFGKLRVTLQHTSGCHEGVPWHILNQKAWAQFICDAKLGKREAVAIEDSILRQLDNAHRQLRPIGAECKDGIGRYVKSIERAGSRIHVEMTADRGAAAFFDHYTREEAISEIHLAQHRYLCVCSNPFWCLL